MRLAIVQVSEFVRRWNKLGLTDDDLQSIEHALIARPEAGDLIPGTGGLRKIRVALPSQRSGGRNNRVIYAYIVAGEAVYLFDIYAKNDKSDLSRADKQYFTDVLKKLNEYHRARMRQRNEP